MEIHMSAPNVIGAPPGAAGAIRVPIQNFSRACAASKLPRSGKVLLLLLLLCRAWPPATAI